MYKDFKKKEEIVAIESGILTYRRMLFKLLYSDIFKKGLLISPQNTSFLFVQNYFFIQEYIWYTFRAKSTAALSKFNVP